MKSRGFTLIELLVVIAIIGLLASIILAALSTARNRAKDAAIKSNLHSIVLDAALHFDSSKLCYTGPGTAGTPACPSAVGGNTITDPNSASCTSASNLLCSWPEIQNAFQAAQQVDGGFVAFTNSQGATVYAVAAQLATDKGLAWCVDSGGVARQEGTAISQGGTALANVSQFTTNGVCQ